MRRNLSAWAQLASSLIFQGFLLIPFISAEVEGDQLQAHSSVSQAPIPPTAFVVESYYRIRWGNEEEFLTLFRKNHVPFLRRQLEKGVLLDVKLEAPREHMTEDSRWDLRMTLVYRDAATAYRSDNITEADYNAIVEDDEAEAIFNREERRRFELLLAHWDVNVKRVELLLLK